MPTNVDPRAGKLLPARSLIDPLALAIGGLIVHPLSRTQAFDDTHRERFAKPGYGYLRMAHCPQQRHSQHSATTPWNTRRATPFNHGAAAAVHREHPRP